MNTKLLALAAFVIGTVAVPDALALETRCVDTVGELNAAVLVASDDDVRINLVQGTYNIDNTALNEEADFDIEAAVTIYGGYNAGCTQRSVNPALTVLSSNSGKTLLIGDGGDIKLVSLTLRNLGYVDFEPLDGSAGFSASHDLRLERVRFDNVGGIETYGPYAYLQQVEVVRSPAHGGINCAFVFNPNPVQLIQIENSLFAGNDTNGVCINNANGNVSSFGGAVRIYNSIFWDNAGADVKLRSTDFQSDVALYYNVIQDLDLVPPTTTAPFQSLNQDPLFLNAANGDFRIGNSSPARNSGLFATPSGAPTLDIDGLARIIDSIDRGPHENQSAGAQFQYTVTNTNTVGVGSLYQAMLDAESTAGFNTIVFNIPGGNCPNIITEAAANPFPAITQDLVVDGRTQPGWVGGSDDLTFDAQLCVIVRGGSGLSPDTGFEVDDAAPAGTSLAVAGIGFSGFGTAALDLRGGGGHNIFGNQFAGTIGATTLAANGYDIRVTRTGSPALSGVQIGGDDADARNLLGGASTAGVVLSGAFVTDTQVINNFIGLAANGSDALPNTYGILNAGALDTTIRDNWIAGNVSDGIYLNSSNSFVQGNWIGIRAVRGGNILNPIFDQPNGGWGVRLNYAGAGSSGNVIGGGLKFVFGVPFATGSGNVIAYNGAGGIRAQDGLGHRISRNRIYANTGLDIDVGEVGLSANDNDAAAGAGALPNRGVNYPSLTIATGGDKSGAVQGSFASVNGTYRIELYYNTGCSGGFISLGDARVFVGSTTVQVANAPAGQNGSAAFSIPFESNPSSSNIPSGRGFVALAIDSSGNTSELSLCREYVNNGILFSDSFETQ